MQSWPGFIGHWCSNWQSISLNGSAFFRPEVTSCPAPSTTIVVPPSGALCLPTTCFTFLANLPPLEAWIWSTDVCSPIRNQVLMNLFLLACFCWSICSLFLYLGRPSRCICLSLSRHPLRVWNLKASL